jgi:hypothetical protein
MLRNQKAQEITEVLDPSQSDACCAELRLEWILVCTRRNAGTVTRPGWMREQTVLDYPLYALCWKQTLLPASLVSTVPYETLYSIVRFLPDGTPAAQGIGLSQPFLVPSVGLYLAARPAACQGPRGCICLTPF